MDTQINPELIINDLLEQNKQLTLQMSVLRAALSQAQNQIQRMVEERQSLIEAAPKTKTGK